MRTWVLFIAVLVFPTDLKAGEYPVSGVWAYASGPSSGNPAKSCASYFKNPKAPEGNIIVFRGSKKTEFNGGYLEEETASNLRVRDVGKDEFEVFESFYSDGEGGDRPGLKRRSYRLRLLGTDKIEITIGKYPSSQFVRCLAETSTTPAPAKTDSFYREKIDDSWSVTGVRYPDSTKRPACFAENVYKDGSTFQLSIDPGLGVVYIWFKDNTWEIKGPFGKQYNLRLNLFNNNEIVIGGEMKFLLLSKNTISILKISPNAFFKALRQANKLVFVMPGTVINSTVAIPHTKAILDSFKTCIYKFNDK